MLQHFLLASLTLLLSNKAITEIGLEYVSRRRCTWAIGVGLVKGANIGWDVKMVWISGSESYSLSGSESSSEV